MFKTKNKTIYHKIYQILIVKRKIINKKKENKQQFLNTSLCILGFPLQYNEVRSREL